jgi:hypothetical protein
MVPLLNPRLEHFGIALSIHLMNRDLREKEIGEGEREPPAPWVEEPELDAIGKGDGVSMGERGWQRRCFLSVL